MNSDGIQAIETRFRAYQLGNAGSSYSYFAGGHFTLIEARLNAKNEESIARELRACNKQAIDTLHITSWDRDHCNYSDLSTILERLRPAKIEYPGYPPSSDTARECLKLIGDYRIEREIAQKAIKAICVDPEYIKGLEKNDGFGYSDIFYHPKYIQEKANDNSTVKLFRKGMFNVASLGDIESSNLSSMLRRSKIFQNQVDVLLLAHHGADNEVNGKNLLEAVKPTITICSNDFANMYGHPHDNVTQRLRRLSIPMFTTKRGDVLIVSQQTHRKYFKVTNYQGNSTVVCEEQTFESKKFDILNVNRDTLRARHQRQKYWR
ncbi:ComEC/Rec2 family competence protein [Achromobacter denitrificans]